MCVDDIIYYTYKNILYSKYIYIVRTDVSVGQRGFRTVARANIATLTTTPKNRLIRVYRNN